MIHSDIYAFLRLSKSHALEYELFPFHYLAKQSEGRLYQQLHDLQVTSGYTLLLNKKWWLEKKNLLGTLKEKNLSLRFLS